MVDSNEFDNGVKMFVSMASSVILSVVPISFFQKGFGSAKCCVSVSSGDGREAVNIFRILVQPNFVEALSYRSLTASHISTGS